MASKVLMDPEATTPYHFNSRCVRWAFLRGMENAHRKLWIEDRFQELVGVVATDVCGFTTLDNHLQVLLRLELPKAKVTCQRSGRTTDWDVFAERSNRVVRFDRERPIVQPVFRTF